jgi:hypothetical protein
VLAGKGENETENPANTAFPSIIHCPFPSFKEFTDLSPNNYPIYPYKDNKPVKFKIKFPCNVTWIK